MRPDIFKAIHHTAYAAFTAILLSAGMSHAEVALTAKPTTTTLPDGQTVPMWGLFCGSATATGTNGAPCTTQTGAAQNGTSWQPPLITVQSGAQLDIVLTNGLKAPTSLVIVGQLGGGLGSAPTRTASPLHPVQNATWPIAGDATGPQFTPPAQLPRVQSFATEVAIGATSTTLSWSGLKPGTYLLESGTHPSIQGPMGLYGVVVVTDASVTPNQAYPGVAYDKDVPLLLSEIDPVQNRAVDLAINTTGFSETAVWSGQPGKCGDASVHTCYPPAVNYDPRYYLINGVSFDRTNAANTALAVPAAAASGNVLLRFVNAGLRMHVPSVVGLDMKLIAEDGNVLPGIPKVQNTVFLAAGKTQDVIVTPPAASGSFTPATYAVFDRQLSLSINNQRDGGMQAYLQVAGAALPGSGTTAVARADNYYLVAGNTLAVAEPAKGVIANDTGVFGVSVLSAPASGTLSMNADGTFTYVPNAGTTSDSFTYQANGNPALTATVTLAACTGACLGAAPTANADTYTSNIASQLEISPSGVLANDLDPSGLPLTAQLVGSATGGTVTLNADGSFLVAPTTPPVGAATATVTFQYNAVNAQHTASAAPATVTVTFKGGSGLAVVVKDAPTGLPVSDYRWIIEEDRSFKIDPVTQTNNGGTAPVPALGTNFHTSHMPVIATGCVGTIACESGQTVLDPLTNTHVPAVCDVGNGTCRTDASQHTPVDPAQVALDPNKRYYISILPGDSANPFISGAGAPVDTGGGVMRPFSIAQDCGTYAPGAPAWDPTQPTTATCGHGLGGAPIKEGQTAVNVFVEQTPLPTAKITAFVFEDDNPLNGENDAGGGVDVLAPNEPGLGGFAITLFDQAGQLGDATGQITYDMFNMPVSNSLAGTIDPATHLDACPISKNSGGIVGMIVTCPKYESDGKTLSPLAGQAVIANLYPGLYEVVATPAAERIAKGEEWLQTNTLDGTKPHEAFIKPGEPAYFQEFGPAGFHVSIGFANPKIINDRKAQVCANRTCNNSVSGRVTTTRLSRTPDQRLYSSGSYDANSFTQCYVSLGDPDEEDFAFTKCNADGTFSFTGLPDGNWRITVFDQWNDLLVDGLSTPVALRGGQTYDMGDIAMSHWRTNVYTRTFFDQNGDGVSQDTEPGLALVPTNIRYRDGSIGFFNNTDMNGYAGFNEIFPFFNWLVLEADTTRFKQTGVHVVYDAGGPADGTPGGGSSTIASHLANTLESSTAHLPAALRFPGSVYCDNADCSGFSILNGPGSSTSNPSTGRIDPAWVTSEAWQGNLGQAQFVEFGKIPYGAGENGGIKGEVNYASTRPFDDPSLLLQLSWAPNVPNVIVNLYKKGTAPDGTESLTLVDTTKTSSWDDWAQGLRSDGMPNMNCPGQETSSPFYFTLQNSTQWLNQGAVLPNNSQFKCYDGWAMLNQVQPAPYDGMYQFPSVTGRSASTGQPTATNCTACVANPVDGTPMLPPGKYVVEVIVPPGYELVKEEDKNILIGDNYIAPVTQQFAGLGSVFILPDQAAMNATYNANSALNPTTDLGATPRAEGDTGSVERFWPCVGAKRIVPDFISLYPGSQEVAPFAGASRNLCDRKEVSLVDQMSVLAKFYIFSSPHVAAHFTGVVNDDYGSEFDPFSPQFGEKFAVPNLPISVKDWAGNEISRIYSDQWGAYNGVTTSTWSPNPPNPTGYAPGMMVMCMNDPGPIPDPAHPGQMMTDPNFNPNYSNFCYEWSFMPGQTSYLDTPVVPTSAFAEGYNPVDCAYPNATPAISSVLGDASNGGAGPWVSAAGHTLTISSLGDKIVPNPAYSGPQATTVPFNQKFVTRHYGFGAGQGTVTIGGVNAPVTSWSDTQITVTAPGLTAGQSSCPIQQRGVATATRCGEMVITAANGNKSVDAITVTIGGKAPSYVAGENATSDAIQSAIDNATPGDLIIVGPGSYNEMLLMWKPVRLQGVGASSVTINANAHPAGKLLEPWRRRVNCLFGLALNGQPVSSTNPYDPSGVYTCSVPTIAGNPMQVDRVEFEGILGWDTSLNGNLAELLQEPTLMGAYEGAGITVLAKGVRYPIGVDPFGSGAEAVFPDGTVVLTNSTADCRDFPSNFLCNPSRIDGMTFTNSSQGGGAIFLHGWNHNTEISNNRVYGNHGTLTGGITIGQGEFPEPVFASNGSQLGYGINKNTWVHNNMVTSNASLGDELYSATPTAAGGVTFCTGADNYRFNFNWVCGNLSTGDGGGVAHSGFSLNGNISNNWILFNQSNNPTIPTHGGGIAVLGASPDPVINGTECGSVNDQDCPPGLSEGTGRGLVINANLIMGNTAESGSGGGIRLQGVNGQDVAINTPTQPALWNDVTITNNIFANNVAGWDGGGVSMEDALAVKFNNNTVVANDTTASAGVLFNTLGAPLSSSPTTPCDTATGIGCVTTSTNQSAGLVTMRNTTMLTSALPATVICPAGYGYGSTLAQRTNGLCRQISLPMLTKDLFWQNRPFHLTVAGLGSGLLNQQNTVTLIPQLNQSATGQCVSGASYWDIGIRGDTGPADHSSGFTLTPTSSILTDLSGGYTGSGNVAPSTTPVVQEYCNGARVPPENGGMGYLVPPGVADATSPNPIFNLTPAATVDEGNNWINMAYGPLSATHPVTGSILGNYSSLPAYAPYGAAGTVLLP
ncbi:MAG TPA: Ig-like domain-containing protein [Gallionellaceae bacterium]